MKRRIVIAVVLAMAVLLVAGCSGVIVSAEYSKLLDKTCALAEMDAQQAEQGNLSSEQMVRSLRGQAKVWRRFKDARDGKAGDE